MSTKAIADTEEARYIAGLIEQSKAAQKVAAAFTQEQVDTLCTAIVWEIIRDQELVQEISVRSME